MNAKTDHAVATRTEIVHLPNARPRNDGTPLAQVTFEEPHVIAGEPFSVP